MKLKQFIFALVAMLSFSFSAFAQNEAKIGTTEYATLKQAVEAAAAGDEIVLLKNVTLQGGYDADPTAGLRIEKALTINGNKKTIDCGSFEHGIRVYITGSSKADVKFENVTIKNNNPYGRCIDMRTGKIALEVKSGAKLIAQGVNSQPLTIGGSSATYRVRVSNATIDAGETGYGIISFVRLTNNIEISSSAKISGLAALYLKEGVTNTTVNMGNGTYTGTNLKSAESGTFGAVVIEGDNNTIVVNHEKSVVKAVAGDDVNQAVQAAFLVKEGATGNKIQVTNAKAQVLTQGAQAQWAVVASDATGTALTNNGQAVNFAVECGGYLYMDANKAFSMVIPQEKEATTVKLLSDVTLDNTWTVAAGQDITLDLNGKTINVAYAEGSTTNHIYAIDNKGTLKITGNGTINARGIFNYGTMTLENGTINAIDGNGGYAVRNYAGSLIMNGGTIATTLEDDHLVNNGGYDATTVRVDEGATFTMNGGELNNICDYTFAIENHGTTTVKGGKATSVHTTVANYGTINIEDGEFVCNGLEGITAHAVWAAEGTTNISGGTFNGKDNYNGFNVDASEGAVVNITGGTFSPVHSGSLYGKGTIAVSGGTFFDAVPAKYCATGFLPAKNADGTYGVQEGLVRIGETRFRTLQAAVEAAQAGDEIVVIADIADVTVDVTKNLTISGAATLNNVGINANGADALTVKGLTFTGNSWINSGTAEALTVSGVTATVAPNNTTYTNSRSAFISLGRSEGQELALTVENSNITVTAERVDAILGWAKITAATITGNVIKGSDNGYFYYADAIKFMSIANGAKFVINNNEIYSNFNGIVFAQNTTRDNAYSVSIDKNKFYGDGADHIWIEITGGNTVHATVNATSANTVNGNAFTVNDIKYHNGVIKTWSSYAGVDVVTDANGKVIGGTLASFSNAESVAEGYEIGEGGAVAKASVAEVNGTKYTSLADALAAANAGDEIKLLANIKGDITVPANVTLNGNGFAISGGILAEGNITFKDVTTAADFDAKFANTEVNIPAGASLQLTGGDRLVIDHGATFNITGTIEDAKTADKATLTPSLKIAAGASITGNGVTFNVNNAYIVANANTTSKNSNANGTLDFNINNSIWEQTGVLAFYVPTSGKDPVVNFELKNSVLTTTSHLVFSVTKGEVVIDNSNVNVGTSRQIENRSTMTIKNGSVVNGAVATSSNAINPGTIIVENATYAVTGEFSGAAEGTGTLIIKKDANVSVGYIKAGANVKVDAEGMAAGDEINFTANLSQFTGTLSVINNDNLNAKVVNGKIVLVERTLAGEGTEASPYLINNIADLKIFRNKVNAGDNYSGKFVKLNADIDLNNEQWEPIGYMGKNFVGNFDGGNFTISNLKVTKELTNAAENNGVGLFGRLDSPATIKNLTIENATVTGSLYVGAVVGYAYTGKAIENVTVKGDIAINAYWYAGVIGGNGYMNLVNNCHVIGNNGSYIKGNNGSYIGGIWGFRGEGANKITNCTVTNLSIEGVDRVGGISGMAHYGNTISDCAVKNTAVKATDAKATTVGLIAGACQGTTDEPSIITGSTVENVKVTVADSEVVASLYGTNINGTTPVTNYVAKIGANYYESFEAAITAAQAGQTVSILKAGTYALKVKDGITITGAVAGVEFANIGAFGCNGANVTFNNVTFTYAENSTYKGLQHSGNLVYNNCTFNGQVFLYGESETFYKCKFNTADSNNYNVWTYGAKNVAFNECTFNSAGKSVLIYSESASVTNNVAVTKSTFKASQAVDGKAAIEMDSSLSGAINLTIDSETTATGFAAGNVSGKSLWNNKKGNKDVANNDITVVVGDETVLAPAPIVVYYQDGTNEVFYDMLKAVPYTSNYPKLEGATIKLLADVAASGLRFMENDMVFDLNGHTYTITAGTGSQGTNTSGFQIRPEVTKDVTFKNGTIKVAEGAPVVYMFNNYATNFILEDVTVDCTNMAWSYGNSCYVVVSRGNATTTGARNVEFKGNTTIENFNSSVAGTAYSIDGTMTVGENVECGGSFKLAAGATLTAKEGLNVETVDGYILAYNSGVYATISTTANVATKAELQAALANDNIKTIVLTADIDYGTDQLAIAKAITLDLGGKTLTTRNAWGGMSIKNNPTVKNGTIVHASNTAAIKVWNATAFEDLVIDVQGKGDANKTIGGIVLQEGNTTRVGSIKNVRIKGAALTNGIETYNCGGATENVIGAMESVTIDAQGTGLLISAPCGTATNCDIKGGVTGIELWIKGNYSATLALVDSDVKGGEKPVYVHDEFSTNPDIQNNGKLALTADEATAFTSESGALAAVNIARAENADRTVVDKLIENAIVCVGDVYFDDFAKAFAAATEGQTITILAGTHSKGTIKLPATLKNVTIKGAASVARSTEKTILKDMTISAADGNSYSYIGLTFDGITFDNSRILLTGWRNGEEIIENLTVTNCTFKNLNDDTNSAPIHINKEANEPVNGFTFTNNVIDGATGGSKSGIYAQVTGNVLVENNTINNVAFRPYVIQVTTDDGIADNFTVKGNTFSGSAVGRAQGLGNNAEGTDNVTLVVSNNIFKGITESQQICYWNFNPETTTADLSKNYYDIDILDNPGKIYYNSAAVSAVDLVAKKIFPIYTELNEDGTINLESEFSLNGGTWGGIDWTLTDDGVLTIAPTKGTPVADMNSGKTYEVGAWREAVRYNSKGEGVAIEGWPYDRTKVKTLIIKEGVISIGSFAAQSYTNLTGEVVIPSTVKYIGQEAFQKSTMTKLTFAPVPAGETGEELCIAQGAFKNLIIEEVSLPADRPVHLHAWVFNNCLNLKTAHIPASVVSVHGTNHIDYFKDFNAHSNPTWTQASEIFAYNKNMETVTFGSEEVRDMFYSKDNNTSDKDYIVATVGLTSYCKIAAAIAAVNENGGTIKLHGNVTLDDAWTIPAGKEVTLDLNGKTISQTKACTASYAMINNKGNLNIVGSGKISFKDTGAGDPSFGWGSYTVRNEGNLVVEKATIEHLGAQEFGTHCIMALYQYSGSTTINGGKISTPNYRSVRLWKGDMTINGGTFDGQVWVQAVDNTAELTVKGGTFAPSAKGDASSVFVENKTYDVAFAVTDGTFNGKVGCSDATKLAGVITGGKFTETAKNGTNGALIATGYAYDSQVDENGYYVVSNEFVAAVNGLGYETFAAAYNVAQAGETITLLADIEATEVILLGKSLTINGNGHKVTSNATRVFRVTTSDTKVTLNDVNMVSRTVMVYPNDIRGISIDAGLQNVELTLNNCSVDFTDATACDWAYAVNVSGNGTGHTVTVNGGTYEGANVINVHGANNTVTVKDATLTSLYPNNDTYYGACIWVLQSQNTSVEATGNTFNGDNAYAFNLGNGNPLTESDNIDNTKYVVAKIGDAYYTSIQDAIEAAQDGETVRLIQNVKMDTKTLATQNDGYAVLVNVNGKKVTIDLNGKKITVNAAAADLTAAKGKMLLTVFHADTNGELTLTDNTADKAGAVVVNVNDATVYSVFASESQYSDKSESGKLTVNAGNYTTVGKVANAMFFTDANEVITVNGGNFHCDGASTTANYPWMFNTVGNNERHVTVNGGTFNVDINHQHRPFEVKVPETLAVRANGDGTWTVVPAEAYITEMLGATVNEAGEWGHKVGYATIAEAIAAVEDGQTITLVKDITYTKDNASVSGEYLDGFVYTGDKSFTIDFNGKTITENGDINDYLVYLKNAGEKDNEITFVNGTIAINGESSNTAWAAITVGANSATHKTILNLNGMKVVNGNPNDAANQVIRVRKGSVVNLNEGTVVTSNGTSYGVVAETTATVNINDGAKVVHTNSKTTGGNLVYTAVSGNGTINVYSGAEIVSDNYGIHNMTTGNAVINIYGGTIEAKVAVKASTNGGADQSATVTIEGGNFEGTLENYTDAATIVVKGGTFDAAVDTKYVATGYICKDNGNGTFGVIVDPKHGMVAQIIRNDYYAENLYFATINEAVQAAQSGETVTLIADVETSAAGYATVGEEGYAVIVAVKEKDITLNLNGKSVTVTPTAEELANAKGKMLMSVFGMDTNGKLTLTGNGSVKVNANGANVYSLVAAYGEGSAVVIENGSYEADAVMASGSLIYSHEMITVMGGTFKLGNIATGANGSPWIFNTIGQNYTGVKVVGGTYPTDINHQFWANEVLVPEAYALKNNGDGTWTVVDAVAYTDEKATSRGASWRHVGYASLEDAIAATGKYNCQNNTVTLIKDITLAPITVDNGVEVAIDLNGKTISGTDNGTASFGLITNNGNLTINGTGTIQLEATKNRGWNAYSSVISNQVGGKLTVNGGTIEHLGGTAMAWGIDNLTNGEGTYAETVINGGVVKSKYIAIRQFLNGVEADNILTVNGGTLEGKYSIYFQDPSAKANSGTLYVDAEAVLNASVYLGVTAGSTEWPVEVEVAVAALKGESTVVANNVPANYHVTKYPTAWIVECSELAELTIDEADYAETGYINLVEKNVAELTYVREFTGAWETIYLPFNVKASDLAEAGLKAAYIYNASNKNNDIVIDFVEIEDEDFELMANYPYLICAAEAGVKEIVVETATLKKTTEQETIDCSTVFEKFTFIGNYAANFAPEASEYKKYYVMEGGEWTSLEVLNPFRFYFQMEKRNGGKFSEVQSIRMRSVNANGEETTGIDGVDAEQAGDFIFDLHGRRVLETEKGGIYIKGGKKFIAQ